jgi:hypothetical protein
MPSDQDSLDRLRLTPFTHTAFDTSRRTASRPLIFRHKGPMSTPLRKCFSDGQNFMVRLVAAWFECTDRHRLHPQITTDFNQAIGSSPGRRGRARCRRSARQQHRQAAALESPQHLDDGLQHERGHARRWIVYESQLFPEIEYVFKHPLTPWRQPAPARAASTARACTRG